MGCAIGRLKRRADFLRITRGGRKAVSPGFVVRCAPRSSPVSDDTRGAYIRVGFTASRAIGGAVARNRARRRLRAVVAQVMPGHGCAGHDYVIIARRAVLHRPYTALLRDLTVGVSKFSTGSHK